MDGSFGSDDFRFRMNGFKRETIMPKLDFGMLTCSSCTGSTFYSSTFDGWIGLAPLDPK
jgi:hypothetical protein